jgi:uncharacterized Zn finger protein
MQIVPLSPSEHRTVVRCRVCGFAEVHTDHVVDRGFVLLARCGRCDHRWTARLTGRPPAPVRVERPRAFEVA